MTTLIQYHPNTTDLALFLSDNKYWIGSYWPQSRHQNGEPPYLLVEGYFDTLEQGLAKLSTMKGNEI